MHEIPARVAYAAAEADVFPVEAQATALAPVFDGLRHRHGHAPVLERTGRVERRRT